MGARQRSPGRTRLRRWWLSSWKSSVSRLSWLTELDAIAGLLTHATSCGGGDIIPSVVCLSFETLVSPSASQRRRISRRMNRRSCCDVVLCSGAREVPDCCIKTPENRNRKCGPITSESRTSSCSIRVNSESIMPVYASVRRQTTMSDIMYTHDLLDR